MNAPTSSVSLPEGPASFVLSAVSGFVDTAGFILLSGIFTAHVTGNLVLAGAVIAGQLDHGGVWVRLALLPMFMLAVAGASWCARRGGPHVVRRALVAECIALAVFLATGVAMDHARSVFSELDLFLISVGAVIAMGIQNALMREGLKHFLPTTMMTGNTTQFTIDLVTWARHEKAETSSEVQSRLRRFGNVLAGFVAGAALGALGAATLRFWSPILPLLAVLILALRAGPVQPSPTLPGS